MSVIMMGSVLGFYLQYVLPVNSNTYNVQPVCCKIVQAVAHQGV